MNKRIAGIALAGALLVPAQLAASAAATAAAPQAASPIGSSDYGCTSSQPPSCNPAFLSLLYSLLSGSGSLSSQGVPAK
ncbi:hypothetical protein [Nocardia sp. NPDC005978]|uniref:hypothetical protein n=1 Tax=unclassified Nocardia TaxID=2637762 RepID=UPI00339F7260